MNTYGVIKEKEAERVEVEKSSNDLDCKINNILSRLGIKHSVFGYDCLKEAIKMGIEDPESITFVTKILYIKLAKKFNKTPAAIERNIRNAISSMPLSKYRTKVFYNNIAHYTNKEFIVHLVHYIQYD